MITIDIEGLVEVQLKFQQALENLPRGIQGALEDMAIDTIETAKNLAISRLKNPGTYLDSFYKSAAPLEVMFGNTHKAARYIEFGTSAHVIEPTGIYGVPKGLQRGFGKLVAKKALRFEKEGAVIFARRVLHPGTQPLWILSDAFREELSGLMEKIKEATKI